MKIIYNKLLPVGRRFHAINLFGILFAKGPCDRVMINHEKIHTAQIREFLFLGFYILYLIEWLLRLIQYRDSFLAYRNISFEREAYAREADLLYLNRRPRFASIRYLKKS